MTEETQTAKLRVEEIAEIEQELSGSPDRTSGCLDALRIVQKHRGWVSDQAVLAIADHLSLSPAEVDSIATFYNLIYRKPVGKHVIAVCDSISCMITGGERLMDYLARKLGIEPGQTTSDGCFTLLPTVCLGHCEKAPVLMLDGETHGNLTEEKIDRLLEQASEKKRLTA